MSRLRRWRATLARAIAPDGDGAARLREAAGVTVPGEDDTQWTRLTGSDRDLPEITQRRMRELAAAMWDGNLLARQLVEIPLTYLLARPPRITVPDELAQQWLDAWWSDPITDVAMRLPEWIRGLHLHGEQVWPVYVDPHSGHSRLGYLDPSRIETVIADPDHASCPIGIVTTRGRHGVQRRYRVIYPGPETIWAPAARRIRETLTDGDCWYWRADTIGGARRGRSPLLPAIDWLDGYERLLYGELDRSDLLRAVLWDVTLDGADDDRVRQRAREIAAPGPGDVRVHNESERWAAVVPQLRAYEASAGARLYRTHILAGSGSIPEHWSGGGGDVNRATAAEMGAPVAKALQFRQGQWSEILRRMARYVIWRRLDPAGRSPPDPTRPPDPDLEPSIEWPEMIERDVTQHTAALQQTAASVAVVIDRGLLTEQTGIRLVASVAERLGVEIDPVAELEAARAEAAGRAAADTMPPPADAGEGGGDG